MVKTKSEVAYQCVITIFILLLMFAIIAPFVLLIMSSISSESSLIRNGYRFIPKAFSLDAYKYILRNADTILRAYGMTLLTTVLGTSLSLCITILLAYPLSHRDLKGRKVIMFIIILTMLFHGGIVPSYILWAKYMRIKNTIWALILPNLLLNPFFIILMKNYFENSIPTSIFFRKIQTVYLFNKSISINHIHSY